MKRTLFLSTAILITLFAFACTGEVTTTADLTSSPALSPQPANGIPTQVPLPKGGTVPTSAAPATPAANATSTPVPGPTLVPPKASFSIDDDSGSAPLEIGFSNTSEGVATSLEWDFGDGASSDEEYPDHRYTLAGIYDVALTVTGPGGTDTRVESQIIMVSPGDAVSLELSPADATLAVQEIVLFSAIAQDQFGNVVEIEAEWSVDEEAGVIGQDGTFTAGTTAGFFAEAVTASLQTEGGSLTNSSSIKIDAGPIAEVILQPTESTLEIGATQVFALNVRDHFGNEIEEPLISWDVSSDVGSIDENGSFAAGTKAGSYPDGVQVQVVIGSSRGIASANVTIEPDPLAKLEIRPSDVEMDTDSSKQFTAAGFDEHGNEISGLAYIWKSDAGNITADGLFNTGSQPGSYEVQASASFGNSVHTASVNIEVFTWSWWPAEGDAEDVEGRNNGDLIGVSFAPGVSGQAFSFDGMNDEIKVPHDISLVPSNAMTLEAWVYNMSFVTDWISLVHKNVWASEISNSGYQLAISQNHASIVINDNLVISMDDPQPLKLNTWVHYALTFDGTVMYFYRDGNLIGQHFGDSIGPTDVDFVIGDRDFQGLLDEVRFYTRALSAEEIKDYYEAVLSGL